MTQGLINGHEVDEDSDWEKQTLLELEAKHHTELNTSMNNVLLIDHIPVIPEEKLSKLLTVLKKIFATFAGASLPEDQDRVIVPLENDESGGKRTKGYCFVEFPTEEQAHRALREAEGYRLDKTHVFSAFTMADLDKYATLPTTFTPPLLDTHTEMEHWRWWLRDLKARDQFVLRYADETAVYWNQKNEKPELVYSRAQWTETYVQWSPLGTYLATFHRQGIALWAGDSWKKIVRFPHTGVKSIAFSPNENYLVTFSPEMRDDHLSIWDLRVGKLLRSFNAHKNSVWPQLKWSSDERYLARQIENAIEMYEVPSMALLDGKAIKMEDVKDMCWSPTGALFACWTPESGNTPARVTVMAMPSRTIVRTKNLFSVNKCTLHWQSEGDYLCVVVDRYTKSKKSTFASFEVFRLREREIPVDVVELKESVTSFAWEPHGEAFIAITGEMPKTNVYFYQIETKKKGEITLFKTLERKSVSHVFWSPRGQFCVLAGLKTMTGLVEFWNTGTPGVTTRDIELLHTTEHYMVSDIEWDPTGRYVTSIVSALHHQLETGYQMYEFHGKPMFRQTLDKFYQFLWRPRPLSLLSPEKQKEIRKNLKDYARDFEEQDSMATSQLSQQVIDERRRQAIEWRAFIQARRQCSKELQSARRLLRDGTSSDVEEDTTVIEEIVEELVDEKIEVIDNK